MNPRGPILCKYGSTVVPYQRAITVILSQPDTPGQKPEHKNSFKYPIKSS